ncbi:ribonuclease H [Nocardia sp. BMG51109]|uniref:ribonuclease H family protein n=1 Tax=Nocardia sp. BMG51109 TaxID=1056816 RepID=UPI00046354CC|nr:ribonuclease H [Nocardia sp. BMG51109]
MIIVSTDGSCLRNPGGAIGWAWVDHQGTSASGGAASGTNQVAELRAVLEAIVAHPGPEPLLIESDSLYAIKCASEWISGWRVNGWRTSTGNAVKNAELVQHIDHHLASRPGPVRFRWVRGHVGNYFNEQADKLAGQAAREAAAMPDAIASGIADLPTLVPAGRKATATDAVAESPARAAAPPEDSAAPAKSPAAPAKPLDTAATVATSEALTLF